MEKNTYNGWYNWETWNFKLWLDNDEYYQSQYKIIEKMDISTIEKWLEGEAEMMAEYHLKDASGASFIHDMVNMSIKEINFNEIANAIKVEANFVETLKDGGKVIFDEI